MFHIRDTLLPHNHAARIRGRLAELTAAISAVGTNRECSCVHPVDPVDPVDPGPPQTMVVGVAAGSSLTIGEDGVVIGTQSAVPGGTVGGRVLAAWDADGFALERIDAVGHVPDPVANGTMTVSYDTPASAIHFKVRDREGSLNTMVLSATSPGQNAAVLPLRPVDAVLPSGGGGAVTLARRTIAGASIPVLRFGAAAGASFALHGVPFWVRDAAFDLSVTLAEPPTAANGTTLAVTVEFIHGCRAVGTVRVPRGCRGETAEFTHATAGFRVSTDGVRRPRCGGGCGTVCTETLVWYIDSGTPVDILGAAIIFRSH